MTESTHDGGCFCGEVRYRLTGTPRYVANCHCSMCRRCAGSPFVPWMTIHPDQFEITKGELTFFRSSDWAERGFCAACGTPVLFRLFAEAEDELDVTLSSLDDPEAYPPTHNINTGARLAWVAPDGLPDFVAETDPGFAAPADWPPRRD